MMLTFLELSSLWFCLFDCFLNIGFRLNLFGYNTDADLKKKKMRIENLDTSAYSQMLFLRVLSSKPGPKKQNLNSLFVDTENLNCCSEENLVLF